MAAHGRALVYPWAIYAHLASWLSITVGLGKSLMKRPPFNDVNVSSYCAANRLASPTSPPAASISFITRAHELNGQILG